MNMDLNETNNPANNSTLEIGGLAYFLLYISDYLPYVVVYALGTFFGFIGNLIIIATIIVNKELHSNTYVLILNLSFADLIISGFVDSFSIIGVFVGKSYFDQRPVLCKFVAFVCLISCITSLMNIGFLAINRYIHICHYRFYQTVFTRKLTYLYCLITWVIGFLINTPNIAGWGGLGYDTKTLSCLWDRLASQSYSIFFPMSSIVIPCVAILFCYIRIFLHSYRSKKKMNANGSIAKSHNRHSLRLAKGLFAAFLLFTVCWLPYGLIVMVDFEDKLPRSAIMFTMAIAHLNSSLNPVLYGIFNSAFKRGYYNLFRMIFCLPTVDQLHSSQFSKGRSPISNISMTEPSIKDLPNSITLRYIKDQEIY